VTQVAFNRPYITGTETTYIADAMRRGHVSGDGHYTTRAAELLRPIVGGSNVLLTTSCTHALEMAALLIDLEPGDEIIMPSFTFVSSANAFALRGARPVFVDIRDDTCNIDEKLIEQAITARTRAVVVVHYAGVACEMDEILAVASRYGLDVIEDNAHGLGGTYRDRPLGSFGSLSTLSFHETKNVHCGEGGALVVVDPTLFERAEIIREKGTDRSRFFRKQVDKYSWVDVGSSYLPSDILAAFLTAQLEMFGSIQAARMKIWQRYAQSLGGWAELSGFRLPDPPSHTQHPAHLFWLLAPDLSTRSRFIAHMDSNGVKVLFHYVPLHSSTYGSQLGATELPITDSVSNRLIRLPLFAGLQDDEVDHIIESIFTFPVS